MAFAIWNVQARTTIQRVVPPDLLGRVTSINRTVVTAASVIGASFGGLTARHLGLHAPFLLGLPILTAAGLLVAASRTNLSGPATVSTALSEQDRR
jgi:predicted MFS family arabinose efflux permease